jgi:hypothetical protein
LTVETVVRKSDAGEAKVAVGAGVTGTKVLVGVRVNVLVG